MMNEPGESLSQGAGRSALLIGVLLLASGCASSQAEIDKLKNDAAIHADMAESDYDFGSDYLAISEWGNAIEALQPGTEPYYDGELYVDHARYLSSIAWATLRSGDVERASELYTDVLRTLQTAEHEHKALLAERDETKNDINLGLNLGIIAAAGILGIAGAGDPTVSQQAQQILNYVALNPLPMDFDSTGQVKAFVGDAPLDEDAIRFPILPSRYPLNSIGKFRRGESWCTASLVGNRLALTNAHCVANKDGIQHPGPFEVAFQNIREEEVIQVERVVYDPAYRRDTDRSDSDFSDDWALLVLVRHPDGRKYLSFAEPEQVDQAIADGLRLAVGGFSGDLNDGRFITMDWGCAFLPWTNERILAYDCATYGGSSGSPIFLTDGDLKHSYVIGVNAGGSGDVDETTSRIIGREGRKAQGTHIRMFLDKLKELRSETGTI